MNKLEKLAYIKGLIEGLHLNEDKKDTKVIKLLMDLLEDIVFDMDELSDRLSEVDVDLGEIEKDVYELSEAISDADECCCGEHAAPEKKSSKKKSKDELYYEVTCPTCGDTICLDEDLINVGEMECPNCGEKLEFDLDD